MANTPRPVGVSNILVFLNDVILVMEEKEKEKEKNKKRRSRPLPDLLACRV